MDTDTGVVAAFVAAYLVLTALLLPAAAYPRALFGGAVVFAVVFAAASRMSRGGIRWFGVLVVTLVAGAVLVFPAFPAMGGTHPAAVPLGFLGMHAAALLWAARRWKPRPPSPRRTPLVDALRWGLGGAVMLSALATIPLLIGLIAGEDGGLTLLLVYPAYFAGMLGAATVYWLLQRIAHLAVGRYLMGVLGGTMVYGAVAPAAFLLMREPVDIAMMGLLGVVAGGLVGPPLALEWE